jgi:mannitol-1-phosphate 5-dehydrogenase
VKAVHFGAGNIGRGFVGLLLHDAGYEVVFADVNAELIDALDASEGYTVHEVGAGAVDRTVDGYRAVNSATDAPPLAIMACENAINATDLLHDEIASLSSPEEWPALAARAVFANTAVDRIVPAQAVDAGLDVTVETFFEWAIERGPFGDESPEIPGAHFVSDLAPYIERKLFTVNTGHAATAYFGFLAGHERISDALADPAVASAVERVLEETSRLIVDKHDFTEEEQAGYRAKILERFRNPELPDTVERVGRQPLRKLGRHERFVGPAAELAERGETVDGLLAAVGAALRFDLPVDPQSVEMHELLATREPAAFVHEVTGIAAGHPLEAGLVTAVAEARAAE